MGFLEWIKKKLEPSIQQAEGIRGEEAAVPNNIQYDATVGSATVPPVPQEAPLPADARDAVLSLLESNLGWPKELNRAYFAGVDIVALRERMLQYQTMPHPQGFGATLGMEKVYPQYEVVSRQIRRVGSISEDAKICSTATCLRDRAQGMDQRTCDNAFEAIKRYAEFPLTKFLFSVPTSYAAVTTGRFPSEDERITNLYKGIENILFEICEGPGEGVMTDQVVTNKLLSIAYGVKYAPSIFESLQRCYETELAKIRENPRYFAALKDVFRVLEQPELIEDFMSVVVEKMGQARDGKSHSRQLQLADLPVMISVWVWPQCTLREMAERFQREIGVPYMEAADIYIAKYCAMGAKAYIHLFFCYNDEEFGVAIAFVPCDEDYVRQTGGMILPESFIQQTEELLRQRSLSGAEM